MASFDGHCRDHSATVRGCALAGAIRFGLLTLLFSLTAGTASAQVIDPFAGNLAPGAPAPYGSMVGAYAHVMQSVQAMLSPGTTVAPTEAAATEGEAAEAPEIDAGETIWEVFVGACAGGAFLGGYSAASATPVAAAGMAAPPAAATAVASAAAVGCALGVATAAVTLSAVSGWRSATY